AAIARAGGRALVASAGGRLTGPLERAGGELLSLDMTRKTPLALWRNAAALTRMVREAGVDLIHARSRGPAWSGLLAARRTGAAFVTTYHGDYSEGWPGKRLYNSVMARGRPVIAISEHIAGILRTRHGVPEGAIRVIPRGADLAEFDEGAVTAARTIALAEAWGIVEDPRPVVLLPARISGWKGQEEVITAAARLSGHPAQPVFVLAGEGDAAAERALLARAERAGVAGDVRLVGHCNDMAAAYKLAAVVLSASTRPEAFGRVAVEAQAMGRPVIATDHGGARETVDPGQTGWLVPPGDSGALAAALAEALSMDESARAHMGLAGRARVRARFSLEAMQAATLAVYAEALGRPFPDAP
ncbi:MAG: glycosyltransferase family 4 protein, partial [Pseudomonadota bacterium]